MGEMEINRTVVNVLMANQQVEQGGVTIEGKCKMDQKELAETLSKGCKEALEGVNAEVKISPGVGVGSHVGEIEKVFDIYGEKECSIQHEQGEVWLLDFWATWCPPCQGPMAHNQEMLEKHGAEWGSKVKIYGLSIDNDPETVKNHVEAKGWQKVSHYHVRRQGCDASTTYGVQGVPHCLLVNRDGIVVWIGHPASRPDLVDDFNKLLKGEMPEGCSAGAAGGAEGAGAEAASSGPSEEECLAAVEKFKADGKKLMDENAELFKFPRAFLVLEYITKINLHTKARKVEMTCHT